MLIATFRTADFRSRRRQQKCKSPSSQSCGKRKPLDAERQGLVAGMLVDVRRLASAYWRRYAQDVPREELTAEAMVGLVYAASRFDSSRGVKFEIWAKLVVHDALAHAVARWRRWRQAGPWPADDEGRQLDPTDRPETDPADRIDAAELLDRVRLILPAKEFDTLSLRFADGLTLAEIGRRREVTHQAVAQVIDSGISRARRKMSQEGPLLLL